MRLEIAANCPKPIVRTLLENFELPPNAVYRIHGAVNLNRIIQIYDQVDRPDLKYPAFVPRQLPDVDAIFERVATGDVLLHHPFDAFTPVLELIRQRSEEHTSELQSLMRISYAVFCLKKKKKQY